MTFFDSSVIIDYLDGDDAVVAYVDEQPAPHLTSSICVYEVLAGEVFGSSPTDIAGARRAFGRVRSVDFTESVAVEAAQLQDDLLGHGTPLSPRDLFVAATARSLGERLVVSDSDFDTRGLSERMELTVLG